MKQYTIESLKEYLYIKLISSQIKDNLEEIYYKERIDRIVNELYDISKKEILSLNTKETFIIRKQYGILDNGICQTQESIGKIFNLSNSSISIIKTNILKKIQKLIWNYHIILPKNEKTITSSDSILKLDLSFYNFESLYQFDIKTIEELSYLNISKLNKITEEYVYIIKQMNKLGFHLKEEPKDKDIMTKEIEKLDLTLETIECLRESKINTIEELISLSKNDLLKIKKITVKSINEIVNNLNIYGLSLKENESLEQENNNQNRIKTEEYINNLEKYKKLILEKEEIQKRLNELNKKINVLSNLINNDSEDEKTKNLKKEHIKR